MTHVDIQKMYADESVSRALLRELDGELLQFYPREHMYGLHPGEERDPALHFFVMFDGSAALGCGALRVLDPGLGEIKRMYVRRAYRGRGLSRLMLRHLEKTAGDIGVRCLRLETGPEQREAISLYKASGYTDIPAYGEYVGSPVSICMEKELAP